MLRLSQTVAALGRIGRAVPPILCARCASANDPAAVACAACGATLAAPGPSPEGLVIDSRYEILQPIGSGGMGTVYKAHDRVLDEDVAIKVLRPEIAGNPGMAGRFRQEIKLARRVRHRNVCGIHEYGEVGELRYIAMEFIDGVNLRKILQDGGALPPERAFEISAQVAEGLQAVHEAGIIHRDLKAPNIMQDAKGIVRLMDFGIAKLNDLDASQGATAAGFIVGTPEYMSPEQARANRLDFRSDIYSLGVVVYEMFTGSVPFRGDTPMATLLMHLQDAPALTGPGAPELPEPLVPVLAKMLAKLPGDRHAEARETAAALRAAQAQTASRATPATLRAIRHEPGAIAVTSPLPGTRPAEDVADPVPVRKRKSWTRLRLAGFAAVLALAAVGVTSRTPAPHPPIPPPAAPVGEGTLVIDAAPWGEVTQILDSTGRPTATGGDRYTPFVVTLPSGDYLVTLKHPGAAEPATLKVSVRASQVERRLVEFQKVDVDAYLEKAGF